MTHDGRVTLDDSKVKAHVPKEGKKGKTSLDYDDESTGPLTYSTTQYLAPFPLFRSIGTK